MPDTAETQPHNHEIPERRRTALHRAMLFFSRRTLGRPKLRITMAPAPAQTAAVTDAALVGMVTTQGGHRD